MLVEEPGARPAPRSTGLFHFALLVPEEADLARFLAHAARDRVGLAGASDHGVSQALYLRDPDGHGIEVYRDRPRGEWYDKRTGELRLYTEPLDLDGVLAAIDDPAVAPYDGLAPGTRMGHVHLQVRDTGEAVRFYRDVLGMDLMAQLGDQAAFLSAGGYHHHIGANTWASRGAGPPPPGSAALRYATVVLPDDAARDRVATRVAEAGGEPEEHDGGVLVSDPSANRLLLTAAG